MKLLHTLLLFTSFLATGCALKTEKMYEGETRSTHEQAVLASQGLYPSIGVVLNVVAIDGKKVILNRTADYLLLPGDHTITLAEYRPNEISIDVKLKAIAGHSYVPQAFVIGDAVNVYLRDLGPNFPRGCMPLRVAFPGMADIPVPAGCPNLSQLKSPN